MGKIKKEKLFTEVGAATSSGNNFVDERTSEIPWGNWKNVQLNKYEQQKKVLKWSIKYLENDNGYWWTRLPG